MALRLVRDAQQGHGGVLLVEGEPGIGKSALLDEAVGEAARRGFSLVLAAADQLGRSLPFSPLLAALKESLGTLTAGFTYPVTSDTRMWLVDRFRRLLENRADTHPVLVSLDDLHWADGATLATLRTLPRQLASYPLVWNLSRATVPSDGAAMLFDLLERDGAARVTLGPLSDDAVVGILTDALGAAPDAELASLASGAAGNPFLLVELSSGLREENAIRVVGHTATLVSAQLPKRIHLVVRHRLEHLSRQARHLLETMAVLGRSFRLEDAAEMLGEFPAALLPLVNEALEAGILAASTEDFAFRHGLVWQAVDEAVPGPARLALHRQFGGVLLARGGAAVAAAAHLLQGARRGDSAAIAGLDQAAEELLSSSPPTAADLAVRALHLTPPGDPAWPSRSALAAEALTAAGRLEEADDIARAALALRPAPAPAAQLRCALSAILAMTDQPDEAASEAEALLACREIPGRLRDEALITRLQALATLGDTAGARRVAEAIVAAPDEHRDAVVAASQLVLAAASWEDGRIGPGLVYARAAVRRTGGISTDARHFQPLLGLAAMLVDLRMLDEATAVIRTATADIQAFRSARSEAIPAILRARIDLATGRPDDAAAAAETALGIASELGCDSQCSLALSVLGIIALRQGNLRAAYGHMRHRDGRPAHAAIVYARTECLLAEAQIREAAVGQAAAIELASHVYTAVTTHRSVLIGDPAASAWLARTALAAGRNEWAADVVRAADEVASRSPVFRTATAAAAHCRGIVSHDPARLAQAAAEHMDPWARASAAEDLGALLAVEGDAVGAITHLDEALAGYGQADAARDLARVRRRLRGLGVRRRYWTSTGRDATGWDSLTETERAISEQVSQGLSNQQVAEQMYVSVHTVASHLRQVFRKLGITSRVELTRRVIENSPRPQRTQNPEKPERGRRRMRYREGGQP